MRKDNQIRKGGVAVDEYATALLSKFNQVEEIERWKEYTKQ